MNADSNQTVGTRSESTVGSTGGSGWPMVVLAVIALFVVLDRAQPVFAPLVLAFLLFFLFRPVVRFLGRARIPTPLGAAILMLFTITVGALAFHRLQEPATEWISSAPRAIRQVERKIDEWRRPMAEVQQAAEAVEEIAKSDVRPKPGVDKVEIQEPTLVESAATGLRSTLATIGLTLLLLFLLLIAGEPMIRGVVGVVSGRLDDELTSKVDDLETSISRYLFTITTINVLLGVAVAGSMHLLGMPNPILWGTFATVANFIPYIGAACGTVAIGLVSVVTFDHALEQLWPPLVYLTLTLSEGNFITPIVLGRHFRLNPAVILIWVILWGWIWGPIGAILAVPLLTTVRILLSERPQIVALRKFFEH